jgi:outer membrane usher protein FimD/PapC
VGLDGEAYLTKLADRQSLIIRYNASRCRVVFELDPKGPAIADVGPLRCEPVASETPRGRQ